jgi:hypothetical protein
MLEGAKARRDPRRVWNELFIPPTANTYTAMHVRAYHGSVAHGFEPNEQPLTIRRRRTHAGVSSPGVRTPCVNKFIPFICLDIERDQNTRAQIARDAS